MKNRFNKIVVNSSVLCCLLIAVISCDTSSEYIDNLNVGPELLIVVDGESSDHVSDSVKTSGEVGQFEYEFDLVASDANDNLLGIGIDSGVDEYLLIQYDSILIDIQIVDVNESENTIKLTGIFFNTGIHEINFIAADEFGVLSSATLELQVFENETPVIDYSIKTSSLSSDIREFDLSTSYDPDEKYGGGLISYHYLIDGVEYATTNNTLRHTFPGSGTYGVSLWVVDNNQVKSKTESFNLTIN